MVAVECKCRICNYEAVVEFNLTNIYVKKNCPNCKSENSFFKKFGQFAEIEEAIMATQNIEL